MAAAKKPPRQKKDPVTHRFQSILTRELVDRLCEVHETGQDFRNVTAVRCGVHPTLLTRWLKEGAHDEKAGLRTELFMRMGAIEADIRAKYIAEVADPMASTETTTYDEGKPSSKVVESRRTQGIQWLLERRFRQFRVEHVQRDDEREVADLWQPQAVAWTPEAAIAFAQQMAADPERLPVEMRRIFATTNWGVPREMTDGQATH